MKSFFWNFITAFFKVLIQSKSAISQRKKTDANIAIAVDTDASTQNYAVASDQTTTLSPAGIELIRQFEGLKLEAYLDTAGVCTIGYGTTVYPNGIPVQINDHCSVEQAKGYMLHDVSRFEKAVTSAVNVPLTQHQFDALVSLTYNIGVTAFHHSTLLKRLNQGDYLAASQQFDVWVKAGGETLQGLVNRRLIEKSHFLRSR